MKFCRKCPKISNLIFLLFLILFIFLVFKSFYFHSQTSSLQLQTSKVKELLPTNLNNLYIKGFVLSLPNLPRDPDRLSRFQNNWQIAYPELDIVVIETEIAARGVGVVKGSIKIFKQAIKDNIDIILIFEDDATPFFPNRNITSLSWKDEFFLRVQQWPKNSLALFLGSHHIKADDSERAKTLGIGQMEIGYGAYAYVVRNHHFNLFLKYFERLLDQSENSRDRKVSGDIDWWETLFTEKNPAFLTLPLLVDHPPGYSATWQGARNDVWSGIPNWWEIKRWRRKQKRKQNQSKNSTDGGLVKHVEVNYTESQMKGYVLSLKDNAEDPLRLQRFKEKWKSAYPELSFEIIFTCRGPPGVGVVNGSIQAFEHAKNNNFEVALIFEDDALPFVTDVKAENASWRIEFMRRLKKLPDNAGALFLGAHHINGDHSDAAIERGIGKVKNALGAYAYVVRSHHFDLLLAFFKGLLHNTQPGEKISADYLWWKGVKGIFHSPTPAFISMPLLVDHAPGFSATWHEKRNALWAGNPIWWEVDYWKTPK